ncbi:hypothetical protein PACTADRAFT_51320 [Pachysolen tannophilus NRRL Y-2460]|uniref:Uncharacterized protein n=1 Tax=Pachysolen tannophilus NRRL Y-2460 TaxID=669874 RepID=A0A1E4TS50_PACTA|nr:hypothetical protein PACTADRAFT_51320 [Pachysolen tannophilus NRRL Y-2460]
MSESISSISNSKRRNSDGRFSLFIQSSDTDKNGNGDLLVRSKPRSIRNNNNKNSSRSTENDIPLKGRTPVMGSLMVFKEKENDGVDNGNDNSNIRYFSIPMDVSSNDRSKRCSSNASASSRPILGTSETPFEDDDKDLSMMFMNCCVHESESAFKPKDPIKEAKPLNSRYSPSRPPPCPSPPQHHHHHKSRSHSHSHNNHQGQGNLNTFNTQELSSSKSTSQLQDFKKKSSSFEYNTPPASPSTSQITKIDKTIQENPKDQHFNIISPISSDDSNGTFIDPFTTNNGKNRTFSISSISSSLYGSSIKSDRSFNATDESNVCSRHHHRRPSCAIKFQEPKILEWDSFTNSNTNPNSNQGISCNFNNSNERFDNLFKNSYVK